MRMDEMMDVFRKAENGTYSKNDLLNMYKKAGRKMFTCEIDETDEYEDQFFNLKNVLFKMGYFSREELNKMEIEIEKECNDNI